jgi:hypothetical protein
VKDVDRWIQTIGLSIPDDLVDEIAVVQKFG